MKEEQTAMVLVCCIGHVGVGAEFVVAYSGTWRSGWAFGRAQRSHYGLATRGYRDTAKYKVQDLFDSRRRPSVG